MKLNIGILILAFMLCQEIYAQHYYSIMIGSGIGTYNMNDLKRINNQMLNGFPVRPEIVNNFPPYPYYKLNAQWEKGKIGLGLSFTHFSTGSRIHYADYSGSISIKQLIRGNTLSLPFKVNLTSKEKLNFFIQFEPGYAMTVDRIKQDFTLLGETAEDKLNIESGSFFFLPGISCSYYKNRLQMSSFIGYLIDAGGKLHALNNPEMTMVDDYNKPIKTNISGLRLELAVGIRLRSESRIRTNTKPRTENKKMNFWDWLFESNFMYRPTPIPRPF